MGNMLHLIPPHGVRFPSGKGIVQAVPVRTRYNSGIVGRLGASFQLDAVHPCVQQLFQVVDHAHIPGIEDIASLFILENGEIFPGTFFLHQGVAVAAGLGAGAPVGVPPRHVITQQATA